MTARITSNRTEGQEKQFRRFIDDARDRALVEVNPDKDATQRLIMRGGEFQAWIIEGVRRFSAKQSGYAVPHSILGADFITPEEVAKACPGIVYTDEQIAALASTLPSADVLRWCKDNDYAVMPAPPTAMSLLEVHVLVVGKPKPAGFWFQYGPWYMDERFALHVKTQFGWLAIRKTPVPDSTSRGSHDQGNCLSDVESVPNAVQMTWFITTYFAVRGVTLFVDTLVRTSSLANVSSYIIVGHFVGGFPHLDLWGGGCPRRSLGVASIRNF